MSRFRLASAVVGIALIIPMFAPATFADSYTESASANGSSPLNLGALSPGAVNVRIADEFLNVAKGSLGSEVFIYNGGGQAVVEHRLDLTGGFTVQPSSSRGQVVLLDSEGDTYALATQGQAWDEEGNNFPSSIQFNGTSILQSISAPIGYQGAVFAHVPLERVGSSEDVLINEEIEVLLSEPDLQIAPPQIDGSGSSSLWYVAVPSTYRYDLKHKNRGLHDYCTKSPDSFGTANFRGPCARHDMAYEAAGKRVTWADHRLKDDMRINCSYAYGKWNPARYQCYKTATLYRNVVLSLTWVQIIRG